MEELESIVIKMKELDSKSSNLDELTEGIVGLVASYLDGRANRLEEYRQMVGYLRAQNLPERLSYALELMNLK